MADVGKTVECLSTLDFTGLDTDWVKEVWERDFTDYDPLPISTEEGLEGSGYHVETLKLTRKILQPWALGEEGKSGEGFWTVLVENDLPHRNFVSFLYYIIEAGSKRVANAQLREAAISAADVYFTLICIPGSGAFKIFHPMLFQKSVDVFKSWTQLGSPKRKRKPSPVRSSQAGRRGKARKTTKEPEQDVAGDDFGEREDEDEDEDEDILTPQEISKLRSCLLSLLRNFTTLLKNYSLKESESSAQHALQILVELSKQEAETVGEDFDLTSDVNRVHSISKLAFMGMDCLCSASHGDINVMITTAFKYLLPSILMLIGDGKGVAAQAIPRDIQTIKDNALAFVCHLLRTKPEAAAASARILLQHMCTKVPDRAEYRAKVAQAVVTLLQELPNSAYARMMEWIYRYSRHAKISYRVFALEIVTLLLSEPERKQDDSVHADHAVYLSQSFLIQMVLARCSDVNSSVRSRAIAGFSQCVASKDSAIGLTIKEMFTPRNGPLGRVPISRVVPTPETQRTAPASEGQGSEGHTPQETETSSDKTIDETSDKTVATEGQALEGPPAAATVDPKESTPLPVAALAVQLTPGAEFSLADGKGVVSMLRRRACDEKVNVRKAALQALENVVRMEGDAFNKQDLDILNERCQDPALSVRKQAMMSLTQLLMEMPDNRTVQSLWLDGVLPMVMDRETGAQERCMEIVQDILLNNIVPYHRSTEPEHKMAWSILGIMAGNEGVDLRRFLQRACQHLSRQGQLKASVVSVLQTHIGTENNAGVWMLLAEMAPHLGKFNSSFVLDYWDTNMSSATEVDFSTMGRVLTVLGCLAKHLPSDVRLKVAADLKQRLKCFDLSPELIAVTVSTLSKLLGQQSADVTRASSAADEWCEELLKACDEYLSGVILGENQGGELDEVLIVRHLFTLGEISQLCPGKTPRRVFMLVQSLIAAPTISSGDVNTQLPEEAQFPQGSQLTQGTQVLSQFQGSKMSSSIRAHAFVTLGKLCLQNEDIAKKCIAAMARELETCVDPAIRNNVVVIMCDLCIRYTTLVDRYVGNIAACLKDENPLIRKQTLTLLTRLLQEDFLKWKGSLFFRFITAVVDKDPDIKTFAEFCLVHLLLQRNPGMFNQHFVECIFHFNAYEGHNVYNKFSQSERERTMFSLKGKDNAEKRMYMYRFMLEHMSDEHRFQLTAKICQEILGGLVDGVMPLDPDTSALLQDALAILCCKEIKLSSMRSRPQQEEAVDEQDMAAAVMEKAKKTLISQVVKKNVIENIVPIVISLKHMLEKHRSPVLKDLMMYLRELMKDYKTEVKEIMSADRQLANEIEFDLRKFEEQQEELELQKKQQQQRKSLGGSKPSSPVGSPQPGTSPKAGPPAVTVQSPGQSRPRSIIPKTPVMALNSPATRTGTSSRKMSLVAIAAMNSARKAVEMSNKKQATPTPQRTRRRTTENTPPQMGKNSSADEEEDSSPPSQATFKTPTSKERAKKTPERVGRAVSTPEASLLSNLTFHQGQDTSMMPLSPIPTSMPLRLYSSNIPSTGSKTNKASKVGEDQNPKTIPTDIVCMFSPDKPTPKPRKWNVHSPTSSRIKEKSQDISETTTQDILEVAEPQRRRTRSARSKKK